MTTTINSVGNGLSGATGTGSFVGSTSPTITTPTLVTSMTVASGFNVLGTSATKILEFLSESGSDVNYVYIEGANTATAPVIGAAGSDTNVALQLVGQGNSGVQVQGTTAGSSSPSGYVGQIVSSNIAYASAITISSGVNSNLTSISLGAGNWEINGNVYVHCSINGDLGDALCGISTASITLPDNSYVAQVNSNSALFNQIGLLAPYLYVSLTSTITYYLVVQGVATGGTLTACGNLNARRI